MKKVLSLIIIIILFVQLTACATENEKPNIKVYNYVNDYEAVLNIDNIKLIPSKGSMLAFESDLSAEEIQGYIACSNRTQYCLTDCPWPFDGAYLSGID